MLIWHRCSVNELCIDVWLAGSACGCLRVSQIRNWHRVTTGTGYAAVLPSIRLQLLACFAC
jgi:hypothetical protein